MMKPTATLPNDVPVLQEMVHLRDQEIAILREQIRGLKAYAFGPKTEKLPGPVEQNQLPLFELETPENLVPDEEEKDQAEEPASRPRRSRGRRKLPGFLPRQEVIHDLEPQEKQCGCGSEKVCIGQVTTEVLERIPAQLTVFEHKRLKYACQNPECSEMLAGEQGMVTTAPAPPRMIPQSIAGHSLLAQVTAAKFAEGLPFYRLERQFRQEGMILPRQTMCRWMTLLADRMQPLWNMMFEDVKHHPYLQMDETVLQVLNEKGRQNQTKSYVWVIRGGPPDRPTVLFRYFPTRGSEAVREWLKGFQGIVQTDGYQGYRFLEEEPGIAHAGCLNHARRKFMAVVQAAGKRGKPGHAHRILKQIQRLYRIEKRLREQGLTPADLAAARQKEAGPEFKALHEQLQDLLPKTPPGGLLGKAVHYTLDQWPRLLVYLDHGLAKLDTNDVENAIRPFVIGRKAWLFAGSPEGAQASALLYSMVETAKANGWNPSHWLHHVFEHLPLAKSPEAWRALLPTQPPPASVQAAI